MREQQPPSASIDERMMVNTCGRLFNIPAGYWQRTESLPDSNGKAQHITCKNKFN
jgi:hypothetical protein